RTCWVCHAEQSEQPKRLEHVASSGEGLRLSEIRKQRGALSHPETFWLKNERHFRSAALQSVAAPSEGATRARRGEWPQSKARIPSRGGRSPPRINGRRGWRRGWAGPSTPSISPFSCFSWGRSPKTSTSR